MEFKVGDVMAMRSLLDRYPVKVTVTRVMKRYLDVQYGDRSHTIRFSLPYLREVGSIRGSFLQVWTKDDDRAVRQAVAVSKLRRAMDRCWYVGSARDLVEALPAERLNEITRLVNSIADEAGVPK